jgi:uncharacterized FlaG/YvyC family protein
MEVNLTTPVITKPTLHNANTPTDIPSAAVANNTAPNTMPNTAVNVDINGYKMEVIQPVSLDRAITDLNKTLAPNMRHMSVETHTATGRIMVAVYDTHTQEVIREIPPERVLDTHAGLLEMAGLIVNTKG